VKKVHLIFGILVLIVFLLTGQFMDKHFHHMVGMPDGTRLLYRTRHIFILLSGLTNLGIAAYFMYREQFWPRAFQLIGSGLTIASSLLFIVAFFYEPGLAGLHTPLSHWGTYCISAGVILQVLSGLGPKTETTAS
jgi:hypothetical protein